MKKPASIIIRDYHPTDYPEVERLWEETGLGGSFRGDNKTVIERSLALGGKLLIASLEDGFVAGTSWMTFDGRRIHLHHFGVSPKYQRQGIGRQLALASIAFAKEKGCQIKLEVHRDNVAAISLYKNMGFEYLGDYDVYIIRDLS
ncbi:MAG TPA: GNAT family N-acetyltransferase [Bacteroidales bacterium]|nr:GNAT family N-acetyltransferase [Bacteroidales bacterium]